MVSDVLTSIFTNQNQKDSSGEIGTDIFAQDEILIPKISLQAPLVLSKSDKEADITEALKKGVLLYPNSAFPGEEGITVMLGHTAPPNWPDINHYHIFNRLNELKKGDEILVHFRNSEYHYRVAKKFFVAKGTEVDYVPLTNSKHMLVLLSCWPPGRGNQRIIIQAE